MAIANPVNSQLVFQRQTAKGAVAPTAGAQILRRETATFSLTKDTFDTETEIVDHQQLASVRHGTKQVAGAITDFLSPGTFSDMTSAVLRRDFTPVAPVVGVGITIAGTGPTFTVTRDAGSYLTDGFKIGMVARLSVGSLNAANIDKNMLITAATALELTVMSVNGEALVAEGPIVTTTVSVVGKTTFTPATGHTNIYYTVETWDPDVPSSERNEDVKIGQVTLNLPGSGNAKIDITAIGLDQTVDTAAYFTTPAAATTTGVLVAASGLLLVGGAVVGNVTDLSIVIDGKETVADGVVGSDIRPDIFRGVVKVSGTFTAYFESRVLADNFVNEVQQSLVGVFTDGSAANAEFVSLAIPVMTTTSSDADDGVAKGKKRTYNFTAIYNSAGGAGLDTEQTTLMVQDSAA